MSLPRDVFAAGLRSELAETEAAIARHTHRVTLLRSAIDAVDALDALGVDRSPPPAEPTEAAEAIAERTCECGRVCTSVGGLRVHEARAHGRTAPESELDRFYVGAGSDGRSRPWRCHCGVEGKGGAGLAAHLEKHAREGDASLLAAASEREQVIDLVEAVNPTDDEIERAMHTEIPVRAARGPRYEGAHRSINEDTAFGGKRVYCECGWVTLPCSDRNDAREVFAAHLDEMSAAREAVA